jgi:hypothetical protein
LPARRVKLRMESELPRFTKRITLIPQLILVVAPRWPAPTESEDPRRTNWRILQLEETVTKLRTEHLCPMRAKPRIDRVELRVI